MLSDFFKLNDPFHDVIGQVEFERLLSISHDLRNLIYRADELKPLGNHPKLKIKGHTFYNFSFSKTDITNVVFIDCKFEDCLFIGTSVKDCEFHNCNFINVNTFKISIENTYINPESFSKCFTGIDKSNIAIHLFQQLINNSKDQGHLRFSRVAEFNFRKWRDKLTLNKYINQKPYKISHWSFFKEYPLSLLFRLTFGYGLRFRNFIVTFIILFVTFFFVNSSNWKEYSFEKKDIKIEAFNPDSATVESNLLYTLDVTTKLIDSQFQPRSNIGMFWLTFQSIFAFILLSALITILINRFVK